MLIPTHGRPDKIAACVRALADQRTEGAFEVLVGIDGEDAPLRDAIARAWSDAGGRDERMRISMAPHAGPAMVRNRLLALARGAWLLLLNDDVIPRPGLLEAHRVAQTSRTSPAMILGAAPWVVRANDSMFDRLVRETSMIFFYDQMTGAAAADPEHDWGFRHAWTLNLSMPRALLRDAGGFTGSLSRPVFEDLEMAYRVHARSGARVLYRPGAVVLHDHAMTPGEYLRREYTLGHAAVELARACPDCARAVFGRDLAGDDEAAYSREYVAREKRAAAGLLPGFVALAEMPAHAADGAHARAWVRMAYQSHLPLKRWLWRRGLLDAHARTAADAARALGELA